MKSKVYRALSKVIEYRGDRILSKMYRKFSLFTGFNYFYLHWNKYGFDKRRK